MTAKDRYQAGRTDLVYWLRSHGEALKRSGSEWEWKYHDERVTIRGHLWFDQYTQVGGDAVKFLQYFFGYSEEDAVASHLGRAVGELEKGRPHSYAKRVAPVQMEKKIELKPPAANRDMRRVFAYLCQTRGIAPEVVSVFAHERLLYESADKHDAVFVGQNSQGKPRHIHMRGTLTGFGFR